MPGNGIMATGTCRSATPGKSFLLRKETSVLHGDEGASARWAHTLGWPGMEERRVRRTARDVTCVLGANVSLYLRFLHGDEVAGSAADRKHPLLLVHVERHVADKLDIELGLKSTHVTAI